MPDGKKNIAPKIFMNTEHDARTKKISDKKFRKSEKIFQEGIEAINENKYTEAVEIFDKITAENPDFPEALYNLAFAKYKSEDAAGALDVINKLLEVNPEYPEAYNLKGSILETMDKFDEAVEAFMNASHWDPQFFDAVYNLASLYSKAAKYSESRVYLNDCRQIDPNNPRIFYLEGVISFNEGNFQDAAEKFNKAVSLRPDFIQAYLNLAASYYNSGNFVAAVDVLRKCINLEPSYKEAHRRLWQALIKLNKKAEALSVLKEASRQFVNDYEVFINLGRIYYGQDLYRQSITAFERAAEISKGDFDEYYMLGSARAKTGDYKNAVENLNRFLESESEDQNKKAEAYLWLGISYEHLRMTKKAIQSYNDALAIDKNLFGAQFGLATAYSIDRSYKEATEAFKKALEIKSSNSDAKIGLAKSLIRLGDKTSDEKYYRDAVKELNEIAHLEPENTVILEMLGRIFDKTGDFDHALKVFRKYLKLKPKEGAAYNYLGLVYAHSGKYGKALRNLKKAVKYSPDMAEAQCNLALTLANLGRNRRAFNALDRALAANPESSYAFLAKGLIFMNMEKYDYAEENLKKAAGIDPRMDEAHYNLGLLYHKMKSDDKLKEQIRILEKLNPKKALKLEKIISTEKSR